MVSVDHIILLEVLLHYKLSLESMTLNKNTTKCLQNTKEKSKVKQRNGEPAPHRLLVGQMLASAKLKPNPPYATTSSLAITFRQKSTISPSIRIF